MKYLLAIAVGLCLTGCATTSITQSTSKQQITNYVMMPDGATYTYYTYSKE
jgi:hypothetical protein